MDRVKELKIKQSNGAYGDAIPLAVDASNVDLKSGEDLETLLNNLDASSKEVVPITKGGTGATTRIEALDGLAAIGYRGLLTSEDDLNLIVDNGIYRYNTDSIPINAPYDNAAIVEVFGSTATNTQKIQRVTRYGTDGKCSFRRKGSDQWGEWKEIAITDQLTATNVGALPITGGTLTGNLSVVPSGNGRIAVGSNLLFWTDTEGGNIRITPPEAYDHYWEMDAFNGDMRIYQHNNSDGSNPTRITFGQGGGITIPNTLYLTKTTDASGTENKLPALIVGGSVDKAHLEFDGNEIMAKADGTTPATLTLNYDGGTVGIGSGGLSVTGPITAKAGITGDLTGNATNVTGTVAIANGGTGATNATDARSKLGLATVASSGKYSDLSGTPTIPASVAVKGNAESSYRTGNVNLTPANIGALSSSGGILTGNIEIDRESTSADMRAIATQVSGGAVGVAIHVSSAGNASLMRVDASGNTTPIVYMGADNAPVLPGNASTATKLATARNINGVAFDGSSNITVADSTKMPLSGGTFTGNVAAYSTARTGYCLRNATVQDSSKTAIDSVRFVFRRK